MLTSRCFLPHKPQSLRTFTSHIHPLAPPTKTTLRTTLLFNLHSHSSLDFAILKRPPLYAEEQVIFEQTRDNDVLKRPQSITSVHSTFFYADRWTHRASSLSKLPPDSTHLCFHPSWHQVGICWFFNICKSLQTAAPARFSQHGQVELMRMTAQILNHIWGFNISWKLDRMSASIR